MSRILLLDRGNRFLKAATAESSRIGSVRCLEPDSIDGLIEESGGGEGIDGVSFSSVVPDWSARLVRLLEASGIGDVVEVRHDVVLPFSIGVDEPERLGPDRISAAAGACAQGAGDSVIVDAGTAVTVDVIEGGEFRGGSIFPGSYLLARALHDGTAALPMADLTGGGMVIPGRGTEAAIRAGIEYGLIGAVKELIRRSSPSGASIWLTGGECGIYEQELEGDLHVDKELVLKGLLEIFSLNVG